jgi:endo-1,4-beta-D-glucanase Y
MIFKSFFLVLTLAFFWACDSSSPTQEDVNLSSSSIDPIISSPVEPPIDPPVDPPITSYYASLPTPNVLQVQTMYNNWIQKFYVTFEEEVAPEDFPYLGDFLTKVQGSARIKWDTPAHTVSEGIGYGLLITYFMQDQDRFNRLFKFYSAYSVSAASGSYFMQWQVKNGFEAPASSVGSATDADLDAVTALLLAYRDWGNAEYLDYAIKVASSIYRDEVSPVTNLLVPADGGGKLHDGNVYNISYFSLVALRLLAQYDVTRSANWQLVLNATIDYMSRVQLAGNGLWPDWSDASGLPTDPGNNSSTGKLNNYFGLEGVRTPLRLAWDYHWFGDSRTKAMLDIASNFAFTYTQGDVTKVLNRYIYQGTVETTGVGGGGIAYQAAFCSLFSSDAKYITNTNACNSVVLSKEFPTNTLYFQPSLQLLYSIYLNGFFIQKVNF